MRASPAAESRLPWVAYVDADPGQLRLFEAQFGRRYRLTLSASAEELLDQVQTIPPVAALLADHRSGRALLEAAPLVLPDAERLLVARSGELSQARAAVERGAAKRCFVKPWIAAEVGAALDDAVRIFELRSQVRTMRARLDKCERLATLGRVSAGLAHELSGPAGYIAQNAAALRKELAGVASYVRRVTRIRPDPQVLDQLRDLSDMVQDVEAGAEHLRQVSRGLTRQLRDEAPIERCDVANVVQQVARLVRPELQGKALLSTQGGPLEVHGSRLRLTQVLINLVVNAAHAVASMQRAEVGRVQIRWERRGERAGIEIIDDGPGLPAEIGDHEALLVTTKNPRGWGPGSDSRSAASWWRRWAAPWSSALCLGRERPPPSICR